MLLAARAGGRGRADGVRRRSRDSRNGSCAPAARSACGSSACGRPVASSRRRCGTGRASGSSGDRDLTAAACRPSFSASRRCSRSARPCSRSKAAHRSTWSASGGRGVGHYVGRLEPVAVPADGSRRERVTATMTGDRAAPSSAIIEDAPEQWWAVFFPIWPDLEREAARPRPAVARARRARMTERHPAAPTCTSTRSPPTARRTSSASSTTSPHAATWTSSPSPTTSASTPRWPRRRWPRSRRGHRGRRRRGGHDPRRPPARAVDRAADPALSLPAHDDQGGPRRGWPGDPGPSARALPAVRPGPGPARPPRRRRRGRPAGRPRDVQSDGPRPPVARSCRALRR